MKIFLLLLPFLLLFGCPKNTKTETPLEKNQTIETGIYRPLLAPKPLKAFAFDLNSLEKINEDPVDYEKYMNEYLPLEHLKFGTSELKGSFEGSYLPVSITAKNENYRSTLEYAKYNTEFIGVWKSGEGNSTSYSIEQIEGAKRIAVPVFIGIRVNIDAVYRSLAGDINITGFEKLGMAVEASHVAGTLELKKAGMSSKASSLLMLSPDSLSHESISNALLSFDKIKSLVYDTDMVITPCILGYYDWENNITFNLFAQRTLLEAIAKRYSQPKNKGKQEVKDQKPPKDDSGKPGAGGDIPIPALDDLPQLKLSTPFDLLEKN